MASSATRSILAALQAAGRKHCDSILDLPSGHGRVLRWLRVGRVDYGIDREAIAGLVEDYRREGFGYRDYPRQSSYGISLATPHRVLGLLQIRPELRVIGYSEATWDAHRDVVACMRSSQPFAADACPPVFGSEAPPTRELALAIHWWQRASERFEPETA